MVQYRQQLHRLASDSIDLHSGDRSIALSSKLEIHSRMSPMTASAPGWREQQRLLVQIKLLRCLARTICLDRDRSSQEASLTLPEIWKIVLRQVCEATQWDYAEVWLPMADRLALACSSIAYVGNDTPEESLRPKDGLRQRDTPLESLRDRLQEWRRERQGLVVLPGDGLLGRVWRSLHPQWEKITDPEIATRYELGGWLAVPVTANDTPRSSLRPKDGLRQRDTPLESLRDRLMGVLVFFTQSDRQPDAEIVELLDAIATQLGMHEQNRQADVATRRRQQAESERRQRDRLLWGVAKAANHLLAHADCQTAVDRALETLSKAAGVDRVYICECQMQLDGSLSAIVQFEWAKNADDESEFSAREITLLNEHYASLVAEAPVRVVASELPPSRRSAIDDTISVLMLPIHIEGKFWGYLGFGDSRQVREWSRSEIAILQEIATSFGSALQRHRVETSIRHQAFHDALTDLPNRTLFDLRLSWAIADACAQTHQLAVMFLDLDRFKWINDTLGHPVGDEVLRQMVQRLQGCLRDGDTIARWGGDEFVLLLPHIHGVEDATHIAQRILGAVQPPFAIDNHQLHVSCSIGIAVYPQDGEDGATLTKNADVALYQVKEQGRNNYQLYQPQMSAEATETLALRNSLPYAIARQELSIYYHPQFNTETGQITGMEALTHWQHPELGAISPQVFIPLAEEMGLIDAIGRWVLQTACAQNKAWQERGFPPICIAVNLSERQFQQPNLLETICQVLEETQLDPQFLELEITEATALKNLDFTRATLAKMQDIGIRITMDDFGIGYASLSLLKRLPFNKVKIDRSFIRELTIDASDTATIDAILALGRGLNLSVVAEGVETEEHRDLLRDLCCKDIQGYLMSLPLNAEDATQLLASSVQL
ncbi:MAG TPA: EAL domain-containing protein [Oscillatoriales cyanobacterium M59_W2019_021]|nr:EAL domain-containing protein [Oscillatoriales cyanobacterium M4454_W2019_049]HIK51054.1 EAL domain-containing protein [Oscillatoriales cyanobacterium M59_W2019_021]